MPRPESVALTVLFAIFDRLDCLSCHIRLTVVMCFQKKNVQVYAGEDGPIPTKYEPASEPLHISVKGFFVN